MSRKAQDTSGRLLLVVLLILSFILLVLHSGKTVRLYKDIFYHILSPATVGINGLLSHARSVNTRWADFVETYDTNQKLKTDLTSASEKLKKFQDLEKSIERHNQAQSVGAVARSGFVLADVVSRDWSNWYMSVVLNRGQSEGVQVKAPVLRQKGSKFYLIGRVIEVYGDYSKALLITDSNFSIYARSKKTGLDGLVTGQNGALLSFKYLELNSALEKGDEIFTPVFSQSGFDEVFLGRVAKGPENENNLLVYELKSDADFSFLADLIILKGF